MPITYQIHGEISADELADVFRRSGIRRPVDDLPRMQEMVRHADLVVTARSEGRLVGVARCLTDYVYCCYLSDLAVDREFQKTGIGRELVRLVSETLGDQVTVLLLAAPEAKDYYRRIGFEGAPNAWIIHRRL